jgi:predicted GNAT family N-acyltransferase
MNVYVARASWTTEGAKLRAVRERVFIIEQGVPRELEWEDDDVSQHFYAYDDAGRVLGTARLHPTGQIGRMAVLPEHRNLGIGRRLLELAIAEARRLGLPRIFLHAQSHAQGFYEKSGFVMHGGEFEEAGIPHVEMTLPAGEEDAHSARTMSRFHGDDVARDALLATIAATQRYLDVQSAALDHALFDSDVVADLVSKLARRHATSRVRILVDDVKEIVARGHRLVELARRLPSKVEIRRATDGKASQDGTFVVGDSTAVWLLQEQDPYAGWSSPHAPVRAERLLVEYVRRFERAVNDPELRLLKL